MSTVLKCHSEIKINGMWYHYGCSRPCDLRLYALLGYNRCHELPESVVTQKIVPRNLRLEIINQAFTVPTVLEMLHDRYDGWNHNYIGPKEIRAVEEAYNKLEGNNRISEEVGWFFGTSWSSFDQYPKSLFEYREKGLEDLRWIYWFEL